MTMPASPRTVLSTLAVVAFASLASCESVERTPTCTGDDCEPPPPSGDHVTSVVMGRAHTCALISTGQVKCWGDNTYGKLGLESADARIGDALEDMGAQLPFLPLPQPVLQLAAGENHTCARFADKSVGCWGVNDVGQLGVGDTTPRGAAAGDISDIALVPIGPADSIAAGGAGTCAVVGTQMFCWGGNTLGQFGLGDGNPRGDGVTAIEGVSVGSSITKVTLGYLHSCVALEVGDPICVGAGIYGNLVQGNNLSYGEQPGETYANAPSAKVGVPVSKIAAGGDHTCVVSTDGRLFCWGSGGEGVLGLGDTQNRGDNPGEVGATSSETDLGEPVRTIVPSFSNNCAILQSGKVKCWGFGDGGINGQGNTESLGDDEGETGPGIPYVDLGGDAQVLAVSGAGAACALLDTFEVKCWGANADAQLGLGDTENRGDDPGEMGEALPAVRVLQ